MCQMALLRNMCPPMQNNQIQSSLDALQRSLGLSSDLEDSSGDADVLGAIGDAYTDLGDLEKAAEVCSCPLVCMQLPQHLDLHCLISNSCNTTVQAESCIYRLDVYP